MAAGLAADRRHREREEIGSRARGRTGCGSVIPMEMGGLSSVEQPAAMNELTPGIVEAVQDRTALGDVVFSDAKTAYKIAAFAPVYINAAPLGNTADPKENRRMADAERFFTSESLTDAERRAILVRYVADWCLSISDSCIQRRSCGISASPTRTGATRSTKSM